MKSFFVFLIVLFSISCFFGCANKKDAEAQKFISDYTKTYQDLYYKSSEAQWLANTDIKEENTAKRKNRRRS